MKKIILVAGARPNFMKIAPVVRAIESRAEGRLEYRIVHTGQHYDAGMSQTFFDELGIPEPDYNLEAGSASHAVQTANIMIRFEKVCLREKPDIVAVVGDVNSTAACGLVAKKLHIDLAHIEAGLRSGDRRMPEEINRMVTDSISDLLFVTEKQGEENLRHEGHPANRIHFVGHVMIDNLLYQLNKPASGRLTKSACIKNHLPPAYAALTMHRPSNVDDRETLMRLLDCLNECARQTPIVFPCHPRTLARIKEFGLADRVRNPEIGGRSSEQSNRRHISDSDILASEFSSGILLTQPLGYMDFLNIWKDATVVLTDSGGIQEETTALKIPCITLRDTTERPITAEIGSNVIVGSETGKIKKAFHRAVAGKWKESAIPGLWDGKASERIVEELKRVAG